MARAIDVSSSRSGTATGASERRRSIAQPTPVAARRKPLGHRAQHHDARASGPTTDAVGPSTPSSRSLIQHICTNGVNAVLDGWLLPVQAPLVQVSRSGDRVSRKRAREGIAAALESRPFDSATRLSRCQPDRRDPSAISRVLCSVCYARRPCGRLRQRRAREPSPTCQIRRQVRPMEIRTARSARRRCHQVITDQGKAWVTHRRSALAFELGGCPLDFR